MKKNKLLRWVILILTISLVPFLLNLLGIDFGSQTIALSNTSDKLSDVSKDEQFYAMSGPLHHALMEWSAVTLAILAGVVSFIHYARYHDVSVPIIGMALLCAGITDAFHTLAATRIISANVPNTDFIPFTWAFSRIFNATIMIAGVSISLWIARKGFSSDSDLKSQSVKNYSARLLSLVALSFVSLAVISVIFAASSEQLPRTTFTNSLITRPYDVVPLALFIFSAVLVYGWHQTTPTKLKFALLLSIIPEIATQVHMSFGSVSLFDNHFNIAHGLKVFAYAILTTGLITSLLESENKESIQNENLNTESNSGYSDGNRLILSAVEENLLEIGVARFSQTVKISSLIFVTAILTSLLVSTVFYVESKNFTKEEWHSNNELESIAIEKILEDIYLVSSDDLLFLSKTPPIQGLITSIKEKDNKNYQLWFHRFNIIISQLISANSNFDKISFIHVSEKNTELNKSFRSGDSIIISTPLELETNLKNNKLGEFIKAPDKILFSHSTQQLNEQSKPKALLEFSISIYDINDGSFFGLIKLQVDFSRFVESLDLFKLGNNKIFYTDERGQIIFEVEPVSKKIRYPKNENKLQGLFPELTTAIMSNTLEYFLGYSKNDESVLETKRNTKLEGYFKTFSYDKEKNNYNSLFILYNFSELESDLISFRNNSLMIGFALSLFALTVAIIFSRKLTYPLSKITRELSNFTSGKIIENLPVESLDEVGVLARSFHNMQVHSALKDHELNQQKAALDQHAIVSMTDRIGKILYVNNKFEEISEYSNDELIGQDHRMLNSKYHGTEFFKELYSTISNGKVWHGEIRNRKKTGSVYWVRTTIVPFLGSHGKPVNYISIRTDITETKENSKNLELAQKELSNKISNLQEVNAELDQFAYVASHDLKSPLNGISQLVTWIEEDCMDLLPDDSKEHLALLKSRSKRIINLLNDLLEYSRVGKQQFNVSTFDLKEIVDEIFDLQGNRDGFTCVAESAELTLQKTPFDLVIRNLVSNAIKHHDLEQGNIEINFAQEDRFYCIKIKDDGPGIPPELHSKALEMFQTLQSRDTTEGSGMGLALVKKTIEYHGGTLTINSDGGRGTEFVVKWPHSA